MRFKAFLCILIVGVFTLSIIPSRANAGIIMISLSIDGSINSNIGSPTGETSVLGIVGGSLGIALGVATLAFATEGAMWGAVLIFMDEKSSQSGLDSIQEFLKNRYPEVEDSVIRMGLANEIASRYRSASVHSDPGSSNVYRYVTISKERIAALLEGTDLPMLNPAANERILTELSE